MNIKIAKSALAHPPACEFISQITNWDRLQIQSVWSEMLFVLEGVVEEDVGVGGLVMRAI